ncbi:hypothetical protein Tco_1193295, partial [Tanacetum coccineum]
KHNTTRTNIVLPAGITFDLPALTITLSLPVGTTYLPAGTFILPKPNKKKCELWDWFNEELDSDWYRLQLNEMYLLLNPNERLFLQNEMTRAQRIRHLQQDINHGLARLTFWKSTCALLIIVLVVVLAMKSSSILMLNPKWWPAALGSATFLFLPCFFNFDGSVTLDSIVFPVGVVYVAATLGFVVALGSSTVSLQPG